MTMVGSTARPGVRRGDVSEEPRRWLLVAVLVAALVPTTHAVCCASEDPRCISDEVLYMSGEVGVNIDCNLDGDYSQVPSFRPSNTIYWYTVIIGKSSNLTIQAGAFKNFRTKYIVIKSSTKVTIESGAFSGVGLELEILIITIAHSNVE